MAIASPRPKSTKSGNQAHIAHPTQSNADAAPNLLISL